MKFSVLACFVWGFFLCVVVVDFLQQLQILYLYFTGSVRFDD